MLRVFRFALLACLSIPVHAEPPADGYRQLEQIRRAAGMPTLQQEAHLQQAADAHARYLLENGLNSHEEQPGLPGFSGISPSERAASAGYASRAVTENLSYGQSGFPASIDALMTGIYHRLGFLDPTLDQIGIARPSIESPRYVYELGNRRYMRQCLTAGEASQGSYYTGVCNPEKRLPAKDYDAATQTTRSASPALILWPPPGANHVSPAFFEESPDPLPDRAVSGNPISVQFNPYYIGQVSVLSFALFDASGALVENTRLLDHANDPNQRMNDHQFALFPLDRLEWGQDYRVELRYIADGKQASREWRFHTRNPDELPVFRVSRNGSLLRVAANSRFAVYLPPTANADRAGSVNWIANSADAVKDVHFIDPNTLSISLGGALGSQVNLSTGSGVSFSIRIIAGQALQAAAYRFPSGSCVENGETARYEATSGTLTLPHVLVDGSAGFDATLRLADGDPRVVFDITALTPSTRDISCRSASFDSRTGRLDIPDVLAAGLGDYRAELGLIQEDGRARLALQSLEAR